MKQIYAANNLPFWSEKAIQERAWFAELFQSELRRAFQERNRAWSFERIEAPMLIPRELLNPEYTEEQIFEIPDRPSSRRSACAEFLLARPEAARELLASAAPDADPRKLLDACAQIALDPEDAPAPPEFLAVLPLWAERHSPNSRLALRPETTPATYAWMAEELRAARKTPPYCCWQLNKSFRREQDQSSKHMRLKEFWQQEFQCAYSSDTADDYQAFCLEPVKRALAEITRCPVRIVVPDRLPAYSVRTFDVEAWNSQKWMELCSISKRIDFPDSVRLPSKPSAPERVLLVCEIATSPDRQHYCSKLWREAWETLPADEHRDSHSPADFVDNAAAAKAKIARREASA